MADMWLVKYKEKNFCRICDEDDYTADMWLVNSGKRMAPSSLLSGVWENVKLSRILGFMSLSL